MGILWSVPFWCFLIVVFVGFHFVAGALAAYVVATRPEVIGLGIVGGFIAWIWLGLMHGDPGHVLLSFLKPVFSTVIKGYSLFFSLF